MPWSLIAKLLGPGYHWMRTRKELEDAIVEAEKAGNNRAVEHLRIILARRDEVQFEKETPPKRG